MNVRVTQIDGTLPNLVLMRLAAHHRARGDRVHQIQTKTWDAS
jgi:hypothetical protein